MSPLGPGRFQQEGRAFLRTASASCTIMVGLVAGLLCFLFLISRSTGGCTEGAMVQAQTCPVGLPLKAAGSGWVVQAGTPIPEEVRLEATR